MGGIALLAVALAHAASVAQAAAAAPEQLASGVVLLRGAMLEERGPDGNTVIFDAPDGLIVVDTGRHAWHSDAILAYARSRGRPVVAIVNTHWHLDHSSGNRRIKAEFPGAVVYTTNAVDRVLADGGFLARNLESARKRLGDPALSDIRREETANFIATMDARDALRPDVAIGKSGEVQLARKSLDLLVTNGAVTDADVWLYDTASSIAVLGDLVTLPAPFFETACPARWRTTLDEVRSVPFRTAIPGHGEPMSRQQIDAYRDAFNGFIDCVEGSTGAGTCAAGWSEAVAPLLDDSGRAMAREYAEYYVGMLRENGGKSAECLAR